MEEKREDGRKHNGGRREGAGRPKMQLIDRRLQRRLYCTQEEYDWVLEQLDKRRAKKRGTAPKPAKRPKEKNYHVGVYSKFIA